MSNVEGVAKTRAGRTAGDAPARKLPSGGAGSGAARGASGGTRPARKRSTPRRVRLTVSRVDPFSVFKIAFLLSVAIGIATVVMVAVLWTVLAGMGVFNNLNDVLRSLDRNGSTFNILDYIGFGRVVSLSVLIAVIDVILMTAIATLVAFLYNICSSLVGGLQLTLTDE
ncbi:DUF3566 domain-containing protein [Calidifontibacter sp. DB0510]|uniref:DUF3566 domain-containing protein n=1 Tax=Metallococcus carri TaxID=1656884 RepID=A0A967EF10_9MICO|nr:DUF3566 domain-containing protein [Metallococcus carri]NHN56191.1 DUF3566 domain-containing protein [Metallococcus carri]NOP38758.1 DUF3566 domain-containing protein [Calidifontibacter sp. DB2511S]